MTRDATRRAPRAVRAAAVGLGLGLLAACSPALEGGTGLVEGGPVAYYAEQSEGGDDALLQGVVEVSETCLVVVDELGQRWLPIFQRPRTTWDGTTLTYGGRSYTYGSSIRLGGGGSDGTRGADYAPEGCDYDYAFSVAP